MLEKDRIKWIKDILSKKSDSYPVVKYFSQKNGDFGDFEGVQFDSERKGGHIYFWSSGIINYQIYDYTLERELVEDALIEVDAGQSLELVLADFFENL